LSSPAWMALCERRWRPCSRAPALNWGIFLARMGKM
jgi:hypothetical protein